MDHNAHALAQRLEEANARLRASEERFRLLVQSIVDYAIFALDPEGRVASWNAGAERLKVHSGGDPRQTLLSLLPA